MAETVNTSGFQAVSPVDALWTIIQGQTKSVRRALAKRLNESIEAEKAPKVKMTEEEFYAKIDRSLESAKNGNVIRMRDNETPSQFLDRMLCTQ